MFPFIIISCGKKQSREFKSDYNSLTIKKFDTPSGADPTVSAEMGGKGFKGEGWETNEDYNILGDPKAVKGGGINLAISSFPQTIRLYGKDHNMDFIRLIQRLMFESLLSDDPVNMGYTPKLATHWKISDDKKEFKFRINPDARWADGKPVTSEDFIATYILVSDSSTLGPESYFFRQNYELPVAESKYIVKIRAKKSGWEYFDNISTLKIMPAHIIKGISGSDYINKFNLEPIPGSGPYTILSEDIKIGQSIALRRRNDYWGETEKFNTGLHNFNYIRADIIADDNLRFEKIKKGELDFLFVTSARNWAEKTDFDQVKNGIVLKRKVYNQLPPPFQGIAMNMRKPPFDDIRIRKAFFLLFDREKFIDKLFYNAYLPTNSIFAGTPNENPDNLKIKFDPNEAQKLLTESGWSERNSDGYLEKNGLVFEVNLIYDSQSQEKYFTIYQEDLKNAGIKLNLKQVDPVTKFNLGNERNFSLISVTWNIDLNPSIDINFTSKTADDPNSANYPGIKDERIDKISEEYSGEFNNTKRIKLLQQVDSLIISNYAYVLFWYAPYSRLLFQNKFGYPEYILPRYYDFLWAVQMWFIDPAKFDELNKLLNSQEKTISAGEVENKYWLNYREKDKLH